MPTFHFVLLFIIKCFGQYSTLGFICKRKSMCMPYNYFNVPYVSHNSVFSYPHFPLLSFALQQAAWYDKANLIILGGHL